MKKSARKPVEDEEIVSLIRELTETNYDTEDAHCRYDDILERYCLYPDTALSELMKELILRVRPKVLFWYA